MMTKDLIQKLQDAREGTRELDAEIADLIWFRKWGKKRPKDIAAEPVSTSIDAAMTLVPERWMRFDVDATAPDLGIDWVLHGPAKMLSKGVGSTPALALCIAALSLRRKE
jgi:hypothetical protein